MQRKFPAPSTSPQLGGTEGSGDTGTWKSQMSKSAAALIALVSAFYLSISAHYGDQGWQVQLAPHAAHAAGGEADEQYDLTRLDVLNRAVIRIKENYVDPERIDERKMIGAAMQAIQRDVAELLVDVEKDDDGAPVKITVRIAEASESFEVDDVDNLWKLSFKFKDIFKFIQANLKHHKKLRDVEYAAIDGMLSTLDPHSVLLRPEDHQEMKLSTRGKFGGLGIVISVREGQLVVVNPIEDTPASRAGVKAGDKLVQIGLDSTVNMALSEAVDMLRGPPNTKADIWLMREGWKKPRKFTLTRANIKVKSVTYKPLKKKIGLVRLRSFQGTTAQELKVAIKKLSREMKGLEGLIIDLRGNPGGLLDQAIKVSDMFIKSGTLVTTVGVGDKLREQKVATKAETRADLPLAVLINDGSASASEIVAGALKNHNRAVLVGQRSFGKGSVQVIYDNKDDSAIKLTIAQYLTPGDISIQSVGVAPDIQVKPITLTENDTDFFRSEAFKRGEDELDMHLEHKSSEISKAQRPTHRVRYLQDPEKAKEIAESPNKIIEDFEIEIATALLSQIKESHRPTFLEKAGGVVQQFADREQGKIADNLEARGVQWAAKPKDSGKNKAQGSVALELSTQEPIGAGDEFTFTATITNTGKTPFHQLRAFSRSRNSFFDGREFLFGTVPPGASRSWSLKLKMPKSILTRRDEVWLEFRDAFTGEVAVSRTLKKPGKAVVKGLPTAPSIKISTAQLPRPRFALTWRVDDSKLGNNDGLLQRGEEAELVVGITNVGEGRSFTTLATLRNDKDQPGGRAVFIKRGRVNRDDMKPGDEGTARFSFKVKEGLDQPEAKIEVSVIDVDIRVITSEEVTLPVYPQEKSLDAYTAHLAPRRGGEITLRGVALDAAPAVKVAQGHVKADARLDDWYRVPLEGGGHGWVYSKEVVEATAPSSPAAVRAATPAGPPVINLTDRSAEVETQDDVLVLSGEALGRRLIKDMLIFVNNKKVFFKSNQGLGGDEPGRLQFSARVPLDKGVNRITLIAREDEERASQRTVIVNRAAP
ncbi:MAG: MXAN_5808 family serine peptidase [Bradymonadia bacterium]